MRDETREFLDGERSRAGLSDAAREETDAWERLIAVMREDVPRPAPVWRRSQSSETHIADASGAKVILKVASSRSTASAIVTG